MVHMRHALMLIAFVLPDIATAAVPLRPNAGWQPPCVSHFLMLRNDAQEKASVINSAVKRKSGPRVACRLFESLSKAEAKLSAYAAENEIWCGIPPQLVERIRKAHARTAELGRRICRVAANPPRPPGPDLSEALGDTAPDPTNIKAGYGTFDTLSGLATRN